MVKPLGLKTAAEQGSHRYLQPDTSIRNQPGFAGSKHSKPGHGTAVILLPLLSLLLGQCPDEPVACGQTLSRELGLFSVFAVAKPCKVSVEII